jgi:hypothetical protein
VLRDVHSALTNPEWGVLSENVMGIGTTVVQEPHIQCRTFCRRNPVGAQHTLEQSAL